MTRLEIATSLLGQTYWAGATAAAFNKAEDILAYEAQLLLDGSGYKDIEAARLDLIEQARAKDDYEEKAKQDDPFTVPF